MYQYRHLIYIVIILMTCYEFRLATVLADKNYVKEIFESKLSTSSKTRFTTLQSKKNMHHQQNYKWRFCRQESVINLCPYLETYSTYSPSINTMADYNYLNFVHRTGRQQQQFSALNLENIHNSKAVKSSSHLKYLPNQNEQLTKVSMHIIYDPYMLEPKVKATTDSSGDHLKTRYLAAYDTPSPTNFEMHPNFQHHIPQIIYKKATIVSHATGSEPSVMTTESIKPLTSIKKMQYVLPTTSDEKLVVNNNSNDYNITAKQVSHNNRPVPEGGSKQNIYAPLHSSLERELPFSSNLPYPPSFISITSTENPLLNYKQVNNKVPDFFLQRQYISLWDSYIPSWQVTKILQQLKNEPNTSNKYDLETLAIVKQYKKNIEK